MGCLEFSWIFMDFIDFSRYGAYDFHGFSLIYRFFSIWCLGSLGFSWILIDFLDFSRWDALDFHGFSWIFMDFHWFSQPPQPPEPAEPCASGFFFTFASLSSFPAYSSQRSWLFVQRACRFFPPGGEKQSATEGQAPRTPVLNSSSLLLFRWVAS